MIWAIILSLLAAFAMGVIGVPQWGFFIIMFLFAAYIFIYYYYPVLFEKNPDKIKNHLRRSKKPNVQFVYHLLYGSEIEADKSLSRIKQETARNMFNVMLLTKQKKYKEAKAILTKMKDNKYKSYYGAVISLHEGNHSSYNSYKEQIKDRVCLTWLKSEEKVLEGNKKEAISILDDQIKSLRGLNLLSAIHYRNTIAQGESL